MRHRLDLLPTALLVVVTAAAAPAWSTAVGGRAQALPGRIYLPEVPGWTRASLSRTAEWEPRYPGADHRLLGRYVDGRGRAVDVAMAVYARQEEGRELVAFGVGVDDRWRRVADELPVAGGSAVRITAPGPVERTVATWYRVAGVTAADPARVKFETARARLLGGRQGAAALHLSAEGPRAREVIEAFARDLGDLDRAIDRTAGLD